MARLRLANVTSFKKLKLWQKCALIALPFLVPIAGLLYLVIAHNNEQTDTAKKELRGVEYARAVKQVATHLAVHRGTTNRALNGDKTAEPERAKAAALADDALRELEAVDQRLGTEFKTPETERFRKLKEGWAALKAQALDLKPEASFQRHTDLIAVALDLNTDVWEYSTLALDPVADTYYLQDISVGRGAASAEDIGVLRGFLSGAVAKKGAQEDLTEEERLRATLLIGSIEQARNATEKEIRNAVRANPALKGRLEPAFEEYRAKTDAFLAKVRTVLAPGAAKAVKPGELFAAGTEAIGGVNKLYDACEAPLNELLTARADSYRRLTALSVAGTLVALLAVGAVVFFVTRAIVRQIAGLNDLFEKIKTGDYKTRAAVASEDEIGQMAASLNVMLDNTLALVQSKDEKDEIQRSIMKLLDEVSEVGQGDLTRDVEVSADITGAIADSFNYTIEQLRKIIGNVQSSTLQVVTAATEISASTEHLATGSESQAEQIVTMSAAIDEMAVSIQQVSENAATSATVAQQALQNARQGNTAVRNTIDGMNRIREQAQETAKRLKRLGETSQEIGQIVQLIDDIADRTSILALNASIQAAAAGDAGRGFAVVAEEVERLAVRSTEATKKIASLVKAIQGETTEAVSAMERNIQEVVGGSKVANQAGQSLAEIETVSGKLAELIQIISVASKQQARGSDALAKSMNEVNQITQQTAAGTKQTSESVNELAELANALRGSVVAFKLPASYAVPAPQPKANGKNGAHANGKSVTSA